MKVLFKNKTKYTKQVYDEYLKFHQNKYGFMYEFYTILIIILICFCIILNLKYSNFLTSFILLIVLLTFIAYRLFYPVKKVQKELKTDKFKKEKEFTFSFYKNFFIISDGNISDKIRYWKLYRAFENNSYFYLYLNKDHAYLLNKNTFSKGNSSEFIKFIKRKMLFRF